MVKKTKETKSSKRRTQVKNLSQSGKSLTTAEKKKVKGGAGKEAMQDFHFAASFSPRL
jgi:hypothetical protein